MKTSYSQSSNIYSLFVYHFYMNERKMGYMFDHINKNCHITHKLLKWSQLGIKMSEKFQSGNKVHGSAIKNEWWHQPHVFNLKNVKFEKLRKFIDCDMQTIYIQICWKDETTTDIINIKYRVFLNKCYSNVYLKETYK